MNRLFLSFAALITCMTLDAQQRTSTKAINDDVLFSPEFHSYSFGRKTNDAGEGVSWYKRFSVLHMSDIHTSPGQLEEALEVARERMDVVVNCGDDANGCTLKDRNDVLKSLKMTGKTVRKNNSGAYVQTPGNHDVTGITKQEYFSHVCSLVSHYSKNVVWGDPEHYRAYGYIDFIDGKHMGDFRMIMLDPFDYNDGEFPKPYDFMSAVFSQKTDGSRKYDILMLGEASLALRGTAVNEVALTPGTINDIAFSALQIDVLEKTIYRVSYGAYLKYDGSSSQRTEKISYRF